MMSMSRRGMLSFFAILSVLLQCTNSLTSSPTAIINPSKVKQVSSKPRAFVYEGFLTELECDHMVSLAKASLKRSAVADNDSGESKFSEVRTSSGTFIPKAKDPIVSGIEDKISTWTFLPKELSVGARFRSDATRSLQPRSSWSYVIRATGPSRSHFRCPELESRSRSDVSQRPREVARVFCDWERRDQSDSAKSLAFRSPGLENRSRSDVSQQPREVARVFC
ncbi:hypothetical protein F2Q68_00022405 [Brassica cretica]|uniref:Uncharacterized protein n=1 Tax=Brassica cretica TaxID=69181 RepID=A0A8S9FYD1_BRACR|nr:hypothetical protein F2Q68_00022405 [Brassica cretica]